jgi:hypothetical protein
MESSNLKRIIDRTLVDHSTLPQEELLSPSVKKVLDSYRTIAMSCKQGLDVPSIAQVKYYRQMAQVSENHCSYLKTKAIKGLKDLVNKINSGRQGSLDEQTKQELKAYILNTINDLGLKNG